MLTLILINAGCDFGDNSKSANSTIGADTDSIEINELPDSPEFQIRQSFISETRRNIRFVKNAEELSSSILNFDHQNAGKQLQMLIPYNFDGKKYDYVRTMMKVYAGMIATDYCVTHKIVFDSKMLALLDKDNDNSFGWNVFESACLTETAKKIAYWHFKNYRVSDGVFYSTKNDFSPFTEDEVSLIIWSKILQDWTGKKYKSEITKKMMALGILEHDPVDGSITRTSGWFEKMKKDTAEVLKNYRRSKINMKYNLGFEIDKYTWEIVDNLNDAHLPESGFSSSLGLGGNIGGGGGPGGGSEFWHVDYIRKQKTLNSEVIEAFETEELITLYKIQSLLASKEFEEKFQGAVHLFRYIDANNDYSKVADILPAFETNENQLNNYIFKKIENLEKNASNTKDRNYIRDFLYSLFENHTKNRSDYLTLVIKSGDDDFSARFIELLLNYKIISSNNQVKLIEFIIEKKWDKYIPRLFDWRFNKDNSNKKDVYFIKVNDFCKKLLTYNRDQFLLNSVRILKKLSYDDYFDIYTLGAYFFKIITFESYTPSKGEYKSYKISPKALNYNKSYLNEIHLIKDKELRNHLYMAVAQNCDVGLDKYVYSWMEKETDEDLLKFISYSFVKNIFLLDSGYSYEGVRLSDEISKDGKTKSKREIRNDEIRFEQFAKYALQKNLIDLDYHIFQVAKYMQAKTGWRIIKRVLDKYRDSKNVKIMLEILDNIKPDKLDLIEIGKLNSKLNKYLIDGLMNKTEPNLYLFVSALSILSE